MAGCGSIGYKEVCRCSRYQLFQSICGKELLEPGKSESLHSFQGFLLYLFRTAEPKSPILMSSVNEEFRKMFSNLMSLCTTPYHVN